MSRNTSFLKKVNSSQGEFPPPLPNFIILGGRAGTTSLHNYLRQHPDIYMPEWKEPNFFINKSENLLHCIRSLKEYHSLFLKVTNEHAIGEASGVYIYYPESPGLIRETLGKDVKFILTLRNPVDAAYSFYNHCSRRENETLKTFEEALAAEEGRRSDPMFKKNCYGYHVNYYYFHRGLYYEPVKRYVDTFGREQLHIIVFEEFVQNPIYFVRQIYRFLGIDETFIPSIEVHNRGSTLLEIPPFWRDRPSLKKTTRFVFSRNVFRKAPLLLRSLVWSKKPIKPVKESTRKNLSEKYYDNICQLERLIGRDLSLWKHN